MLKAFPSIIRRSRPKTILIAAVLWFLFSSVSTKASDVELPLFLQTQILQNALQQSFEFQPDGNAVLYQGDAYNYLHISEPLLNVTGGEAHFTCRAFAGAGVKPLEAMPAAAVEWSGSLDLNLFFYLDPEWRLRFTIIDSAVYEEDGSKALLSSFAWQLAKRYLHPVLESFSFDLAFPRQEIVGLLRVCASPEDTLAVEETLGTLRAGALQIDDGGVVVPLLLTVDDRKFTRLVPPEPEKPLSEEELEAFQKVFEPMDAFLVFVVKTAGADFVSAPQRDKLFELLITSRYQLLSILAGEVAVDTQDPLRILFVNAWKQLKSIVEDNEGRSGLMQERLLRYMTFINAGDALLALDATAPQLGMHITTDGLRRLARMLSPDSGEDPLRFDWQVDPALRDLFNFLPEEPAEDALTPDSLLRDFFVGTACAAELSQISPAEGQRLDRWVPVPEELDVFKELVEKLLQSLATEQAEKSGLAAPYAEMYSHLVSATALMESCWRQYVKEDGKIVFLRSRSGSIGMMQVNQHVWRGFFDLDRLKWDTVYNIQAGTSILMRYFTDYGLRVAEKYGKPEYAARSAYSAYNAGPQSARRFLKKDTTSREKQVDSRLWQYLHTIATGGSINLSTCSVDQKTS